MALIGLDISNWQGIVDWDAINNNDDIKFCYFLISDGVYRGQPPGATISIQAAYVRNVLRCRKPCGGYWFARPHLGNPVTLADMVVRDAGKRMLPLMYDLEDYPELTTMSREQIIDWSGQWLQRVQYLDGRRPIIYNGAFFRGNGIIKYFPDYLWWLPAYTANTRIDPNPDIINYPDLNGNHKTPDIWQYTSHGRSVGVDGNVDKNVITTTAAQLLGLLVEGEEMADISHIVSTEVGSQYALDVLGNNSQSHGFRVLGKDVMHLDPDELELFQALLYVQVQDGVPEDKRTIVIHDSPLPDVWFTSNRFCPRP